MERKEFLKKTFALCGLSILPAAVMESCSTASNSGPTNVNLTLDLTTSANATLNTTGNSLATNGVLVICLSASNYVAYAYACTHQGCQVSYSAAYGKILCPCHGGSFSASTGVVLGGPPQTALTKYTVTKNGNILTIKS